MNPDLTHPLSLLLVQLGNINCLQNKCCNKLSQKFPIKSLYAHNYLQSKLGSDLLVPVANCQSIKPSITVCHRAKNKPKSLRGPHTGPVRALISKLNRTDQSNPIYDHPCRLYQFVGIIALVTLIGDDTEDINEEDGIVLAQSKSTSSGVCLWWRLWQ